MAERAKYRQEIQQVSIQSVFFSPHQMSVVPFPSLHSHKGILSARWSVAGDVLGRNFKSERPECNSQGDG